MARPIGFTLGLANGLSNFGREVTGVTLQMIRNLPDLALISRVILWFGEDESQAALAIAPTGRGSRILWCALVGSGMARPHSTGLGIDVDTSCNAVIDAEGRASRRIFAIGRPMRGAARTAGVGRRWRADSRRGPKGKTPLANRSGCKIPRLLQGGGRG